MAATTTLQRRESGAVQRPESEIRRPVYTPNVDIYETAHEIVLLADLPGADEKSIDVTVEQNVLSIHARVRETLPQNFHLNYAEYGVGDYSRTFTLGDDIDRDRVEASYRDGVLTLRLPKTEAAKGRKISVKTN